LTAPGVLAALTSAVSAIWLIPLALLARRYLHILQLEEYSNQRFLRWAASPRADRARLLRWPALVLMLALAGAVIFRLFIAPLLLLILLLVPAGLMAFAFRPRPAKKRLVYTSRIKRLVLAVVVIALALGIVASALTLLVGSGNRTAAATIAPIAAISLLLLLDCLVVAAANLAVQPAEALLRQRYMSDAYKRIRRLEPKIIAITGSYGKTTTKELTAAILASRFYVSKTPESWNTLMGVTRAIRERLSSEHEIFVVEMGAYQRGEIAALCRLTGPSDIGILTGINEQHLERFGGIENTIRAKYELIEAVKPGGIAIFNVDNDFCRALADKTTHARVIRVGLIADKGPLDYTASEISVSSEGTRFICVSGENRVPFRTRLLGEHFILNVLAATAAAVECGMSLQQISASVAAIPPVPHRLQLTTAPSGVTTIDDAYSANPDGARAALRVLGQMDGNRRILVTPGFVELGDREEDFNRDLGRLAVSSCDILVLVGARHTAPIREGALSAGMDAESIEVFDSIGDARGFLQEIARPGDTILFENDLPDNYDE
jgi:UDP-N-acetylmuramoyl-tripeptide--D-alanyl-D-alanine ligase